MDKLKSFISVIFDDDKKINIALISIGILFAIVCICIMNIYILGIKNRDVILVKDMTVEGGRIITNKTEILKNDGDKIIINSDKVDDTENNQNLEEEETDNIKSIIKNAINSQNESLSINDSDNEPLKIYNPGEVISILSVETIEDTHNSDLIKKSLYKLSLELEEAAKFRNQGREFIYYEHPIVDYTIGLEGTFRDIIIDNGAVIIPFNLSENTDDELSQIKDIITCYNAYGSKIPFILLNTSYLGTDRDKVEAKFNSLGIQTDIPIYYDTENSFEKLHSFKFKNIAYIVYNCDSYVFSIGNYGNITDRLTEVLNELDLNNRSNRGQDMWIIQNYEETTGEIPDYSDEYLYYIMYLKGRR